MNNKFLLDYLVLFVNTQHDLLDSLLKHKKYDCFPILKDLANLVSKTISSSYNVIYELDNVKKDQYENIEELEIIKRNILHKDVFKIYDDRLKEQFKKVLTYVETLEHLMLHFLPDIDDSNYVLISKMVLLFEVCNDLFE